MLLKKYIEPRVLQLIQFQSGKVVQELLLDKKKILVGSSPSCDLIIDDPSISHYHAILITDNDGGKIVDLESGNGSFINGEEVKTAYFSDGDVLKFGLIEFHSSERPLDTSKKEKPIFDQDENLHYISKEDHLNHLPELPPAQGLVVIDGEYCDITFDESHFKPIDNIPAHHLSVQQDFIDFSEDTENLEVFREKNKKSIEVIIMSMGTVLSVDYFKIKDGSYFASSHSKNKKTVQIHNLESEKAIPFLKIDGEKITLSPLPGFNCRNTTNGEKVSHPVSISENEVLSFDHKTIQVIVKIVNSPPSLRLAPFFGRDKDFQKQTAKFFSAAMGIMLLLLFVDIKIEVPEKKKISIIYKKAIQAENKSSSKLSQESNKQNIDKGIKKKQENNKEARFAKKMKEVKKSNKKNKNLSKKLAKAKARPNKAVKRPKLKSYKFKMNKSFSSMFSTSEKMTDTKIKNLRPNTASGFETAKTQDTKGLKSTKSINTGSLGKDFKGKFNSSAGAFGLASKSGMDTSFVNPKTVVLGSMDPELLRKMLREYLPQFRHCYQRELEINEGLKGIIDLDFRIDKTGSVSRVNIKMKNAKFSNSGVNCMAKVLKIIPFPGPKGGGVVDVRQPLSFFSETEQI